MQPRLQNLARDLSRQTPASLSSVDRTRLEELQQHYSLNFFTPANALQKALAVVESSADKKEKDKAVRKLLQKIDDFRKTAERACQIVNDIKDVLRKYLSNENSCGPSDSRRSVSDLNSEMSVGSTTLSLAPPGILRNRNDEYVQPRSPDDRNSGRHRKKSVSFEAEPEPKPEPKPEPTTHEEDGRPSKTSEIEHCHKARPRNDVKQKARRYEKVPKANPTANRHQEQPDRHAEKSVEKWESLRKSPEYSVFISHCGEDKDTMAIPLHNMLTDLGISSFVDRESMKPGRNGHEAMTHAMNVAQIGVFIVSPECVPREWPIKELSCFLSRSEEAKRNNKKPPILIQLYYRMNVEDSKYNLFGMRSSQGRGSVCRLEGFHKRVESGEASYANVRRCFQELAKTTGIVSTAIENKLASPNAKTPEAQKNRDELLQKALKAIISYMSF